MQIFYAPGVSGKKWILDEKESRHCVRVLRMKKDTPVRLIDGKGNFYEGIISDADPKGCIISINSVTRDFEKRNYALHIAISPLKNPERFEWFIEKSVEIGIDEITPIICRNSEKKAIRTDRINNIIIAAMKQSLKAKRTILNPTENFNDFLLKLQAGRTFIAHCSAITRKSSLAEVCPKSQEAVIMIGPEGDFSDDEIMAAVSKGFIPVHLGQSRLRAETAGIAACYSVYFLNQ